MPLYYDPLLQVLPLDLDKFDDYFHLVESNDLFPTLKSIDSLLIKIFFFGLTCSIFHIIQM
jgi:hypothetical protein